MAALNQTRGGRMPRRLPPHALFGVLLALSSAAAAQAPGKRCLQPGQVPQLQERLKELPRREDGLRHYELTEALPSQLQQGAAFEGWLVVPLLEGRQPAAFVPHPTQSVLVTPLGTFAVFIDPARRATRVGAQEAGAASAPATGVLMYLCFDPSWEGELAYPLPLAIEEARKRGMLTDSQRKLLTRFDKHLEKRFEQLWSAWEAFRKGTAKLEPRSTLVARLTTLYAPAAQEDLTHSMLNPGEFLEREQRVRLRARGFPVDGLCRVALRQDILTLEVQRCPRSQLVQTWNQQIRRFLPAQEEPAALLSVSGPIRHEEVELTLSLPGPLKESVPKALDALLAVEGLQRAPPPVVKSRPSQIRPSPVPTSLTQSDIMGEVVSNKPAIVKCMNEQRKRDPTVHGKLYMRWTIQKNGKTAQVTCDTPEFCSTYLATCLEGEIRSWVFPKHQLQGEPMRFPFVF